MTRGETKLVGDILEALKCFPIVKAWRWQSGVVKVRGGWMHLAPKGTPDVGGIIGPPAVPFVIETKWTHKPNCKCESCEAQRDWRFEWEKRGGLYVLARHVDDVLPVLGLPLPVRQYDLAGVR